MMEGVQMDAVELSSLRVGELDALVDFGLSSDLSQFRYVSVHAPGKFAADEEQVVADKLRRIAARGWPIVLHPDAIHEHAVWRSFGAQLLIENMDKRKSVGRTATELTSVFELLPEAGLCFDIAHARQVDSSLTEAYRILRRHGDRVRQIHISDVSSASRHDRLSPSAVAAYQQIASMIPFDAPAILETPLLADLETELERAKVALGDTSSKLLVGQ
jgi:hypothetical protein